MTASETNKRRGRPAFTDIETKSKIIHFRVTPTEHRKIMAACEYNGQSVRDLMLSLLDRESNRSVVLKRILESAEEYEDDYYDEFDDYETEE